MTDDGPLLLRAVLEQPAEDTPRLMYADRLQENGQLERAEFIRVQIELDRLPTCGPGKTFLCDRCGRTTGKYAEYTTRCRGRVCRLRQREYYSSRRFVVWDWSKGIPAGSKNTYARGFVSEIELPCADFMAHAAAVFAAHPVTAVRLTDKDCGEPRWDRTPAWQKLSVTQRAWGDFDQPERFRVGVPDEIWELLPKRHFRTGAVRQDDDPNTHPPDRDTGMQWLSAACVAHGRRLAGLCELEPAVRE